MPCFPLLSLSLSFSHGCKPKVPMDLLSPTGSPPTVHPIRPAGYLEVHLWRYPKPKHVLSALCEALDVEQVGGPDVGRDGSGAPGAASQGQGGIEVEVVQVANRTLSGEARDGTILGDGDDDRRCPPVGPAQLRGASTIFVSIRGAIPPPEEVLCEGQSLEGSSSHIHHPHSRPRRAPGRRAC